MESEFNMREATIQKKENENLYYMVLDFEYDKDIVDDVRKIKNRTFDPNSSTWKVAIMLCNVKDILTFCKKWNFKTNFSRDEILRIVDERRKIEEKEARDNDYTLPADKDYLVYAKRTGELRLFLVFDYSPVLVDEVKEIGGAKFIKNSKRIGWEVNVDLSNIDKIKAYLSMDHVYCDDPGILEAIGRLVENKKSLAKISSAIEPISNSKISGLAYELRPFQKAGVEYALRAVRTFIADDMGCGKTIEALATFQASGVKKCLVVCPSGVKYNWLAEAEKWIPKRKSVVLEFNKKRDDFVSTGNVNIINYDMLTKMWPLIKELGIEMVIFDESHRLIHSTSQWSKTALEISKTVKYCLLLSGTPIVNRPSDLIHQLNVLDRLSLFGGDWRFKQRYCDLQKTEWGWRYDGATNLDELHNNLRSICYVRRTKDQVLKELPSKQRSYIPIVLQTKDAKTYEKAEKDIANWIISNQAEIRRFFASLKDGEDLSLKHFEYVTKAKVAKAEALIKISKLRKIAADGKLNAFIDWVDDFMKTGKKLIIFAVHRDIVDKLCQSFKDYGVLAIHGGIGAAEKQKNVEQFQNDPSIRLIVCNIQSGGVGLTLTAASDVAFVEFGWTPAEMVQAEDRAWRISQVNNVNIWYFFAKDTIDIDMIKTIQLKERIIDAAVDGVFDKELAQSVAQTTISNLLDKHKSKR